MLKVNPEHGDMKLVRGSWLADPHNIERFGRQQVLPREAIWAPDELHSQLIAVRIVAISYRGLHPVNPDPHCKHLRELQRAIRLRLSRNGPGQIQDLAIFLDYMSLPQHGEQGDESGALGIHWQAPCMLASFFLEVQWDFQHSQANEASNAFDEN